MMGEKPKRARRLSRAVDRVAEWLLPDPDAEAEHELQTMLDQGKQTRGKKPPEKG